LNEQPQLPLDRQLKLLRALLDVAPANDPARMLEIVLLQALAVSVPVAPGTQLAAEPMGSEPSLTPAHITTRKVKVSATPVVPEKTEHKKDSKTIAISDELLDAALWPKILNELKKTHNTLYGVMRMAAPEFEPGLLRLRFQFAFHQKRMNEAKHRAIVGNIILKLSGHNVAIECVHDREAVVSGGPVGSNHPTSAEPAPSVPASSLSTISNIFGGGELLES
jgi:hypothetical protein